eukprot:358367-Chlamydomonas_euryale.AAC.2
MPPSPARVESSVWAVAGLCRLELEGQRGQAHGLFVAMLCGRNARRHPPTAVHARSALCSWQRGGGGVRLAAGNEGGGGGGREGAVLVLVCKDGSPGRHGRCMPPRKTQRCPVHPVVLALQKGVDGRVASDQHRCSHWMPPLQARRYRHAAVVFSQVTPE